MYINADWKQTIYFDACIAPHTPPPPNELLAIKNDCIYHLHTVSLLTQMSQLILIVKWGRCINVPS